MIYITGDTHGDMNRIVRFCERMETSKEDIMIILGDVGLNYYGDSRDRRKNLAVCFANIWNGWYRCLRRQTRKCRHLPIS